MSYVNVPLILPFKFIKWRVQSIHFDEMFTRERVQFFEMPVYYKQKWIRSETTTLQIESSVVPEDLKYYNSRVQVVKSTPWVNKFNGSGYAVYEVVVDFSDIPQDTYFLHILANDGFDVLQALTEPIDSRDNHRSLLMYEYNHHFNDYDVAFSTGIQFKFFCESGLMEFQPKGESTMHVNQTRDVSTLNGLPYRSWKLVIGRAGGVAPYVLDIMNRIFRCSRVLINGKRYSKETDAEIERTAVKGNHLQGGQIEIVEAFNNQSLVLTNQTALVGRPGIVTAYNIETAFFGPGALVPITDIEKQS